MDETQNTCKSSENGNNSYTVKTYDWHEGRKNHKKLYTLSEKKELYTIQMYQDDQSRVEPKTSKTNLS